VGRDHLVALNLVIHTTNAKKLLNFPMKMTRKLDRAAGSMVLSTLIFARVMFVNHAIEGSHRIV